MEEENKKMACPHFHIKTKGIFGKVFCDDRDITRGVRGIKFEAHAGEVPTLVLEINGLNVDIDTDVLPQLPEPFSDFYEEKKFPEKAEDLTKSSPEHTSKQDT